MARAKQNVITLLWLLVVLFVALWFGCGVEHFDNNEELGRLKVFVYETSVEQSRTQNLEKLLTHFHYDYEILGKGEAWTGWHGRHVKYREATERVPDDNYILFCDGRDVLINEDCSKFMKKAMRVYNKKPGSIIFNSESACCNTGGEFKGTDDERSRYIQEIRSKFESMSATHNSSKPFLNFGVMFGKCRDFKELFHIMNMQPGDDDQGLITMKIMKNEFTNFQLDYKNELFCITFDEPGWDETQHMYYEPELNVRPSLFHFPGKTKWYESCATKLMKVYLNESPFL